MPTNYHYSFGRKVSEPPKQGTAPLIKPDLRAKFQIPAQTVGVEKIATLVKSRETATMDEITDIITSEKGVTQRLMHIAYPKAQARLGATVQMATSRLGVNRVIVVMIGELLTKAVLETFETMVGMPLEVEMESPLASADHGFMTGAVRFTGETNGLVTLAFSAGTGLVIASQLLGGGDAGEHSREAINDSIGELVNIVTGNLQSKLCDAGMKSEVGLPEVAFRNYLPKEAVDGGTNDHFFFKCGMHRLAACLSVDPNLQGIHPNALNPRGR
jgi:CheY-specific phosphatase CheX